MPALLILESPDPKTRGLWIPIAAEQVVLGRIPPCDIVLECPPQQTSRQHARIVKVDGVYCVEDLKSRNGTFVNDQLVIGRSSLRADDVLRLGSYTLLFSTETAGAVVNSTTELSAPWLHAAGDEPPGEGERSAGVFVYHSQDRTRMFLRVSVELNRVSARGPLVERVCELLLSMFPTADGSHVMLLDTAGRLAVGASRRRTAAPTDVAPHPALAWQSIASRRVQVTRIPALAPPEDDPRGTLPPPRWGMFAPMLAADGRPLGVFELDGAPTATFTTDDLELFAAVAGLTAVAVERVRLQDQLQERQKERHELAVARKVQLGLLPQTAPALAGYDFYGVYSPARSVGGDYYDYIHLPDGRVAVLLGDVSGKGVPAALVVAKLSSEVRFCLLTESTPAAAVARLNDRLIEGGIGELYVTLLLCVLNPADHSVCVVNAGHLLPLVYRGADHSVTDATTSDESGFPVGIATGMEYSTAVCHLGPADFLLLYTDGVTEGANADGQLFGFERVPPAVIGGQSRPVRVRDGCNRLLQSLRTHTREHPQSDDIAVVGFGRYEQQGDPADSGTTGMDLQLTEWAGPP